MVLDGLEPRAVFRFFEELTQIPHGSGNTDKIADYCVYFAMERGLECMRDRMNNVIIKKPKTPDCKSDRVVILQGHLDMVCAAESGCDIDFENEGLRLKRSKDYIYAEGTTLGGDDGIAVAMALAVLDSHSITHPALECVFTTDEEVGMLGASALNTADLKGEYLLNIDSEDEGEFTVSCAGGARIDARLPKRKAEKQYSSRLEVAVDGLTGGHSGVEIHTGRANACVVLGRLLAAVPDSAIVTISGGEKDNAIPRSAKAVLAVNDPAAAKAVFEKVFTEICAEYQGIERRMTLSIAETDSDDAVDCEVIRLLTSAPNGVKKMSADFADLAETSSNLGIIEDKGAEIQLSFSVRSSVDTEKDALTKEICSAIEDCGGTFSVSGEYPAWEYRQESHLRELCKEVYKEQYGREPKISAIHAGLECGIFCGKMPWLDCISFGPDILDIHTPRERLDIQSAARVYAFLLELLKRV